MGVDEGALSAAKSKDKAAQTSAPTWRAKDVGETDPRTPMGIGGPSPFRFGEGGG